MAFEPVTAALQLGSQLIDRLWPDPEKKAQAQLALLEMAQRGELAEFAAKAEIVKAEVSSDNWLASSWRPILMLTFGWLIVSRWYGWAAPGLSEAEYLKLWEIIQFGLSGYVVGRSAEKIAPSIAAALKK